jgi:hypothetical protein
MRSLRQGKHLIILAILALSAVARGEPVTVRDAVLELNPEAPQETRLGRLDYLGGLILASDDPRFGGYSGMAVDRDGRGLWALSDTGHWLRLDFATDAAGLPLHVVAADYRPLRDAHGAALAGKHDSDAESLRHAADGSWLVAFERRHRIWRYAEPGGRAVEAVPLPASVDDQPENGGLEAIAVLPGDGLLLLSEEKRVGPGRGAAWLRRKGVWQDRVWPVSGDFKPTDATALPDGGVVVLERYYRPLVGPKARLRLLPAGQIAGVAPWAPVLLAEWARPVSVDNMEALDVRQAADGSQWLYVMSDDNQSGLQRTLLMVFRLRAE